MERLSFEERIKQSAEVAEKFVKLFYESMDKARQKLPLMYLDDSTLSWNGNGGTGKAHAMQLILTIPPTEHTVTCFDAQPLIVSPVLGRESMSMMVAGAVRYDKGQDRAFQQSFVLVIEEGKARIYSDIFRIQDD